MKFIGKTLGAYLAALVLYYAIALLFNCACPNPAFWPFFDVRPETGVQGRIFAFICARNGAESASTSVDLITLYNESVGAVFAFARHASIPFGIGNNVGAFLGTKFVAARLATSNARPVLLFSFPHGSIVSQGNVGFQC